MERKISSKTNKNLGKKIFKKLAFMSLAVCMGVLTLFGTACTPTQGSQSPQIPTTPEMTTETAGLIYPKAEDPTLYTTESGIEIKYGLSTPTIQEALGSGNLAGFPYFTTTKSSTTYTWVIIGMAPDLEGNGKFESLLFSNWQQKTNHVYAKYFKNYIFETQSPAGSAINSSISGNSYVMDYATEKFPGAGKLVSNSEIPMGSILCLSNTSVGTSAFVSGIDKGEYVTSAAQTFSGSSNTLRALCESYYTNDTFGFGSYKSSLKNITLKQIGLYGTTSVTKVTTTTNLYFFPLDIGYPPCSHYSFENEYMGSLANFRFQDYLTVDQFKLADYVMGRTMLNQHKPARMWGDGTYNQDVGNREAGAADIVRPACVISLS